VASGERARALVRPRPVRVGGVELDFVRRAALVGGSRVHLSGSALSLLYLLAANAGRVLTRTEIQGALWAPGRKLAGNSVDRLVLQLRRGLGDRRGRLRFVETVVGDGYRFVPRGTHPGYEAAPANATGADVTE